MTTPDAPATRFLSRGLTPEAWVDFYTARFAEALLPAVDSAVVNLQGEGFDNEAIDEIIRTALIHTIEPDGTGG